MPTLNDAKIKTLPPGRHFDGEGLYVEVSQSGSRLFRLKYRIKSGAKLVERRLALGPYPTVSLREAREQAHEARKSLRRGVDPSAARREGKEAAGAARANTFELLAREWIDVRMKPVVSEGQVHRVLRRLERDVFPSLGKVPIDGVSGQAILRVLRVVEARGAAETARRELQAISQVMEYAVASKRLDRSRIPTTDLKGALRPVQAKHQASITEPIPFGALLRAIDGYGGFPTRCALQLLALFFCRPGELRAAAWSEFDIEAAVWRIPAARMKGGLAAKARGEAHVVPLARQAIAILEELKLVTGHRALLFPSTRGEGRPMSDMTLTAGLRRLGYTGDEVTAHGFRATARTMAAERLGVDPLVIEAQLAHRVPDSLGRAYNRTQYLEQRRDLMVKWADYLDRLRAGGAEVVQLRA